MFKLDLEKAEEPEIKLPTSGALLKKQGSSRKTSTSDSLTMLKPLTMWITTNCGKCLETAIPDYLIYPLTVQMKNYLLDSLQQNVVIALSSGQENV